MSHLNRILDAERRRILTEILRSQPGLCLTSDLCTIARHERPADLASAVSGDIRY